MAYRRPGVIVIQEFLAAAPALAAFTLPSVVIGPAYHIVNNDPLGTYTGIAQDYPYAGLPGGSVVDTSFTDSGEMFPVTKKQMSAILRNTIIEIVGLSGAGYATGDELADITPSVFASVVPGDIVTIFEELGVQVVGAQTNGVSSDVAGQRNRLTAGTPGEYGSVKAGDTVEVTAGTNTLPGTYAVLTKLSNDLLVLDAEFNDGVGPSNDVAYSITGDRGVENAGDYVVKDVPNENVLVLQTPFIVTPDGPLDYVVKRKIGDVPVPYLSATGNGFTADETQISLPIGLQVEIDTVLYDILAGVLYASYRGLRTDLAAEVREYEGTADLNAVFGASQIVPANPLAYGLSIMLQNTVTPVNGLGLDENAETNTVLSYTNAAEVLETTDMYALVPLSQSPVVHTLFKNHVDQLSQPERKQERVVIINSLLRTVMTLQDEQTTVLTANNSRVVVNTQVDGSGDFVAGPNILNDATPDQFLNVAPGDSVVIVGGTGVTPGTYPVSSKTGSALTLGGNFITVGTPIDIQYYIYRADGLSAGGLVFYDRNGQFLANGVAPGHFFEVTEGALLGRYRIGSVQSDRQLTLATAIPGVVSLQTGITYTANRDMTKSEQAETVAGYSKAFSDRRVVHCWPDILEAPVGATTEEVPGYYGGCTIAALTTGLPTQQGFTNLAVSGFLGVKHSTRYFTEAQLDVIAGAGTLIFAQDKPDTPLYVRHQLTTDMSSIKFQEFSVTKNVDYIAKFLRTTYAPYIGQYNIIDTTLDALKTTAEAVIVFFRDNTIVPRFGGVVREGLLTSLSESDTEIDTVNMTFQFRIPIPLNHIDIVIQV
jgi:hypothetical protein